MKFSTAIVVALLALGGCSTVPTVPPVEVVESVCKPRMDLEYWGQYFQITLEPLTEEARANFLLGFNASPPVSDYQSKEVYLILVGDETIVAILYNGTCIELIQPIERRYVDVWLQSQEA